MNFTKNYTNHTNLLFESFSQTIMILFCSCWFVWFVVDK